MEHVERHCGIGNETLHAYRSRAMILELAVVLILVLAISVFAYRGSVHEFQILQRDYIAQTPWDELLNEQLPVVVRNVPKSLQGGWNESRTGAKRWPVLIYDADHSRRYKTTWDAYLAEHTINQPVSTDEIATIAKLDETLQNWTADGFHKWYWLPTSVPKKAVVAQPSYIQGVTKATAEATLITNTEGEALHIWLAHGAAIPSHVVPELLDKNPWIQTTDSIPWISEVKYVEIILRPGKTLLVPRHWYYAIQADESNSVATWYWVGEFHSPVSWLVSKLAAGKK
jgi:hypothetical protein